MEQASHPPAEAEEPAAEPETPETAAAEAEEVGEDFEIVEEDQPVDEEQAPVVHCPPSVSSGSQPRQAGLQAQSWTDSVCNRRSVSTSPAISSRWRAAGRENDSR